MKKIIALLALFVVAAPALALEGERVIPVRVENRIIKQDARQGARAEVKIERRDIRADLKGKMEEVKVERKDARNDLREKMVEAKKGFMKAREDAKKELNTKLAKIKDAKKRDAVQRIDDNIAALNKKTVDHYTDVLSKLSSILDRVSERADRAQTRGVDVTTTRVAITDARTAITNANAAVKGQSEKAYKLAVTDEATLKQKVGEIRKMLRNDLAALFDVVKGSRELVRKAATTLAQTPRINDEAPEVVSPVVTPISSNNQ